MLDALKALLRSRKFLLALLDAVISSILFTVGKYFPASMEDAKYLIGVLQVPIVMVIGSIAYEDAAEKRNGAGTLRGYTSRPVEQHLAK
jgi:hypothetical protein